MRFRQLDLNLLVVLDALLAEQNVSRAADRLALTQPAVSNSLAKLRRYFGDDLLVKMGRKMSLTPLAESLKEPVREALMQMQSIVEFRPEFDPATVYREFDIVASDYVAATFLAGALRQSKEIAPGISFQMLPISDRNLATFGRGEADLLIIPERNLVPDHPHRLLFQDQFTCIAWSGNRSIGKSLSLEAYLAQRHVVTAFEGEPTRAFDEAHLRALGHRRKIVGIAPQFTLLPFMIIATPYLATVHERLAEQLVRMMPLKIVKLEFDLPTIVEYMQWHRMLDGDLGIHWLRDLLIGIAKDV